MTAPSFRRRPVPAALAGLLLALLAAVPVAAKGEAVVTILTPIPPDARPGTAITVEWVLAFDVGGDERLPMGGTPIVVRLIGPSGETNEAFGTAWRVPGGYRATVRVPAGGIARVVFATPGSAIDAVGTATRVDHVYAIEGPVFGAGTPLIPADAADRGRPSQPASGPASTSAGPATTSVVVALGLTLVLGLAASFAIGRRRRPLAPA